MRREGVVLSFSGQHVMVGGRAWAMQKVAIRSRDLPIAKFESLGVVRREELQPDNEERQLLRMRDIVDVEDNTEVW